MGFRNWMRTWDKLDVSDQIIGNFLARAGIQFFILFFGDGVDFSVRGVRAVWLRFGMRMNMAR
jgi:hypothetical protein